VRNRERSDLEFGAAMVRRPALRAAGAHDSAKGLTVHDGMVC
jgi:hypothetical protein